MLFYFEDVTVSSHFMIKQDGYLSLKLPNIEMKLTNVSFENVLKMCIMTKEKPNREIIGHVITQKIDIQEMVNCREVTTNGLTFTWKNEPCEEEKRFWYLRLKYHCYWYDINTKTDLIYDSKFKWKDFDHGFIELSDSVVKAEDVD